MINKERLIAITDGIIAVAATVMVLGLDIPEMVSLAGCGVAAAFAFSCPAESITSSLREYNTPSPGSG